MQIYNTLTRKKEPFKPITPGQVKMYTCGQTVYNDIHIGNARFYVAFDAIRRYLNEMGYKVDFVQNFTDIDDKLIARAAEENTTVSALAEKYIASTLEDLKKLNVLPATHSPRATQEIGEIIKMISQLVAMGSAYEKNGSVYFDTSSAPNYGKLSKKNIEDLIAGARVEVSAEKRNPADFILWKPAKPGEPSWESPWSLGRPGWHIECSAMVRKYLGEEIDIHGGGSDLVFPHHENEIAQSEAANGCNYARFWMHSGLITVNHKKMSKSLGNFQTLKELSKRFPYNVIRFFLVSGHYRMPLEFTDEVLNAAKQGLNRISTCYRNVNHLRQSVPQGIEPRGEARLRMYQNIVLQHQAFDKAMQDDFNTADAITAIYGLVAYANTVIDSVAKGTCQEETHLSYLLQGIVDAFDNICCILGIELDVQQQDDLDEEIDELIEARQAARARKDFAESDRLRDELTARGIILEDTPQGPRWHRA